MKLFKIFTLACQIIPIPYHQDWYIKTDTYHVSIKRYTDNSYFRSSQKTTKYRVMFEPTTLDVSFLYMYDV